MKLLLFVAIGGAIGAISRFLLSGYFQKFSSNDFPIGTLGVNIIGSFFIGMAIIYFEDIAKPEYKALFVTGILGALTTFSTFSYETTMLLENANYIKALANIILNVVLTITATILGILFIKKFIGV